MGFILSLYHTGLGSSAQPHSEGLGAVRVVRGTNGDTKIQAPSDSEVQQEARSTFQYMTRFLGLTITVSHRPLTLSLTPLEIHL